MVRGFSQSACLNSSSTKHHPINHSVVVHRSGDTHVQGYYRYVLNVRLVGAYFSGLEMTYGFDPVHEIQLEAQN